MLNPVRAGLCDRPETWWWSSYRATVGLAPSPAYLDTAWVIRLFDGDVDNFRLFIDAALQVESGPGSDPDLSPG